MSSSGSQQYSTYINDQIKCIQWETETSTSHRNCVRSNAFWHFTYVQKKFPCWWKQKRVKRPWKFFVAGQPSLDLESPLRIQCYLSGDFHSIKCVKNVHIFSSFQTRPSIWFQKSRNLFGKSFMEWIVHGTWNSRRFGFATCRTIPSHCQYKTQTQFK